MFSQNPRSSLILAVGVAILGFVAVSNAEPGPRKHTPASELHYKCYQVVDSEGFKPRRAKLQDFYMVSQSRVYRPALFCNPVIKNDGKEPRTDNRGHVLVCYDIYESTKADTRRIRIDNQFGRSILVVAPSRLLCVPSDGKMLR